MTSTRIVPLGGLGEVGMNCLALETSAGILVIDCGVMFPHDALGVELLHPDFRYLWERRDEVLGIVVTHGHEDHIGALPYLLRQIPVPVWAPPYALALIRGRLAEHPEVPPVDLRPTVPRGRFTVGPFRVEPLRVTHSIPDATALVIDTPAGRVLHTGDFKLEAEPLDGEATDELRLRELGDEGVAVLLSDSTNVDVPGRAGGEREVATALYTLIHRLEGRVVVALFASNVFRVQSVLRIAQRTGRKVCYLGRSVQNHARAAGDLGRLSAPADLVVPPDQAMNLPPREVLFLASGTQAEPGSALVRMARGDHPRVKLEPGDAVVFSSRAIPGNERGVFDLICGLERRGIEVHFRATESDIHVSGHAARDEQARMIELVRPQAFVPVHGTYHHLRRHAELAATHGVGQVKILEDGQTATWSSGGLASAPSVAVGRVAVDQGVELDDEVLAQRAAMAQAGVVVASLVVNRRGALVGAPGLSTAGVVSDDPPAVVAEAARLAIDEQLRLARGPRDTLELAEIEDAAKRALRRMYRAGDRRPVVVVAVTRAADDRTPAR